MEKITVIAMDDNELDQLIDENYPGCHYECIAAEEWSNYESHDFSIKKGKLGEYDLKKLKSFNSGVFEHGITSILLQDLCNKEVIEEGKYLIKVFW
jgi:hypothetical protein